MLVCHQNDVCTNYIGSVYVGGYGGLSENGLCVFSKLCPVGFLVVYLLHLIITIYFCRVMHTTHMLGMNVLNYGGNKSFCNL